MKTITFLSALLMVLSVHRTASANDGKYIAAMEKNIQAVYNAGSMDEYQNAVNSFERIAGAEKDKWEPHYYAAFGYIMMANQEQDGARKDGYLDRAVRAVHSAKEIVSNEPEVLALEGFANMIRITVDPSTRGPQYGPVCMQLFEKVVALDPQNPRALALMAQMQYGTAQFFGSPTTDACNTVNKALEKFTTYKSENPLAPQWGLSMAQALVEKCKGNGER